MSSPDFKTNPVAFAKLIMAAHGVKPMAPWQEKLLADIVGSPRVSLKSMHATGRSWNGNSARATYMDEEAVYWMGEHGVRMYDGMLRSVGVDWGRPGGDHTVKVTAERQPDGTMRIVGHTVLRSEMYIDDPHPVDVEAIRRHIREHIDRQQREDMEHLLHGGSSIQMRLVPGSNPPRFEPR